MSVEEHRRNAKLWAPRHLRKTRSCLALTSIIIALSIFLYKAGNISLKTLGLYDPLWSYESLNASATTFPPHDPIYAVFELPHFSPSVVDEPIQDVRRLPSNCLYDYFATGVPCHAGPDPPLDVVWTWVNGSDRLFQESMGRVLRTTDPRMPSTSRVNTHLFRDHDELRHSIRSVLKHFSGSTTQLQIVTSDFHIPIRFMGGNNIVNKVRRLGLIPRWLDPEHLADWQDGTIRLGIKYHSEIFRTYDGPSFNSYGIETQLVNMHVSENFIYMNDDFFMMTDLSSSDFYTSVYGVVLRMQADLLVKSSYNPYGTVGGEWGPLEFTNWCLSNRFGSRKRPYMTHVAKSLSLSLMKEFSRMWNSELTVTASHPFRGMKEGHRDIYFMYLFSHGIVERWREGLLWSWIVAKLGGTRDEWGLAEKQQAWRDVGGQPGEPMVHVVMTTRTTVQEDVVRRNLEAAGHSLSGKTRYAFASGDGYPYDYRDSKGALSWPSFAPTGQPVCTLSYEECFDKPGSQGASGFFKYVAFEKNRQCGDCIIHALRAASGTSGLVAVLPDAGRNVSPMDASRQMKFTHEVPHLPLVSDWKKGDFSLQNVVLSQDIVKIREWTLRMLERYRFVIGQTPTLFHQISSAAAARIKLKKIDEDKDVALLCLNDNIMGLSQKADEHLQEWQERHWGRKAHWER